jgi:hypothetical protein
MNRRSVITSEYADVMARLRAKSAAEFFGKRGNESDWEWFILGSALKILEQVGGDVPELAEKHEAPDFLTFRKDGESFVGIEVTEVLRSGYRRNKFHLDEAKKGRKICAIPPPHPTPWKSLAEVLKKKFRKVYPNGTWLLVYLDLSRSDFYAMNSNDFEKPWDRIVTEELAQWPRETGYSVDIERSPFERILLMSSDCSGLMEIFPSLLVLKPARPIFPDEE